MHDFIVYPDNSVSLFGKYLKPSESEQFLERHKISPDRKKDEELKVSNLKGFVFFNTRNTETKFCRCGKDITNRHGAVRCITCAERRNHDITLKNNREIRGHKPSRRAGYEALVLGINDDLLFRGGHLKDLSWTGTSGETYLTKNGKPSWTRKKLA